MPASYSMMILGSWISRNPRWSVATWILNTNLAAITDGLLSGQHAITLTIEMDTPAVLDDATADQLNIHELIWAETSYFYGSSPERIQNIKAAASRFHGLLVAPGATFSMSDALG